MDHVDDLSMADLHEALDHVEDKTPALRLVAAIAHKNGVSQTELADWFGVERKTIYNWLRRLDREPLAEAARDADRPGRPSKLTRDQRRQLDEALAHDPRRLGYEAPEWTPRLVAAHVREAFGVDYSTSSCRRLLRDRNRGAAEGKPKSSK